MSPLKKRAKRAADALGAASSSKDTQEEKDTLSADNGEAVTSSTPAVEDLDTLFEDLVGKLQSTENGNETSFLFSSLFTLKTWQHDLLERLQVSEKALGQAHQRRERQQRALLSLQYEQGHLDAELETCRTFEMKHLKQLASEEVDTEGADAAEQLKTFLQANVHDPRDRQKIVGRLHQELNSRGSLERDLKLKQQELEQLERELQNQSNFLQALPDHLASLERASLPLQKFMSTKQPDGTKKNHSATMIGTERQQRIELAQTLPPPLYTLFQQLQHYLDQPVVIPEGDGSSIITEEKVALGVISGDGETDKQVVLQLSVPDVLSSSGRSKCVSIHFYYNSTYGLVTAIPRGCSNTLNQDILLDQLFPNDHPASLPGAVGRPYHWCNYLAGLHMLPDVPAVATTDESRVARKNSTRVVLRELQRRVRANATLKHILYSLHRNHVPSPSGVSAVFGTSTSTCKLIKFVPDKSNDNKSLQTLFHVTLGKGEVTTKASVSLNVTAYPSETPRWTLMSATPDGSQTKLYDDRLAALENYVNASGLEALLSSFPESTAVDETAYEWILVLQLRHILQFLSGDESNSAGSRQFKGRDHALPTTEG